MADRDAEGNYTGPAEKTIQLKNQIEAKGADTVSSITVKEPTARQMSDLVDRQNRTNYVDAGIHLIAAMCGLDPGQAGLLGKRDFEEAMNFCEGFSKLQPATPSADLETK